MAKKTDDTTSVGAAVPVPSPEGESSASAAEVHPPLEAQPEPAPVKLPEYQPAPAKPSPTPFYKIVWVQWTALFLTGLLAGAALVYFLAAAPADLKARELSAQLNETQARLETSQGDLSATRSELETAKAEFTRLQAEYRAATAKLDQANLTIQLFKLQMDVTFARFGLVTDDEPTARLALALADKDLKLLEPLLPSDELAKGLGQRLLRVRSFLGNDTEKALEELRKLNENLAMISDSLR